jgi:uncharacterized membrane protein YccC
MVPSRRVRRLARRLGRRSVRRLKREVTAASVHAGLRAATATVAPLALAYATGRHELVLAGVGGWLTCMADVGGAPRARLRAMGAYVVLGALAYAGGALAGQLPGPAVALLVALVAAGGGLLRAAGDAGATLGVLTGATFCAALAAPGGGPRGAVTPSAALAGAGLLAAGSVWAMLLALVVWPVRPYAAARDAAAACYRALAAFARGAGEALAEALGDAGAGPRAFTALARAEHPRVRSAIQAARGVLVATRRGRLGGSRRADDVAVLLDGADALFLGLLTAAEAAEAAAARAAASGDGALAGDGRALAGALALLGTVLDEVADAVPSGRRAGRRPPSLAALEAAVVRLVESGGADAAGADGRGRDALRHAGALLEHAAGDAERAADAAAVLAADGGHRGTRGAAGFAAAGWLPAAARTGAVLRGAGRLAWRDAAAWARAVASPGAPTARHALRLGAAVGGAQLLGGLLHVTRGPWLTITTLIVLQPSAGLTLQRSAARVAGTVAGGVLAALLAAGLRDVRLIAAAAFVLAGAAVALRAVHYGVFTFFLTPVFVLIAQPAPGNWALAGVRVVDTMLGGAVAVLAGTLLWPAWEAASLPATAAAAVEASRAHLALAVRAAAHAGGDAGEVPPAPQALGRARRRAGLAATAGEGALERLLAEPRGRRRGAALLALLARTRRVNGAAAALAAFGPAPHAAGAARLAALGAEVDALLAGVAEAARAGRGPGAAPPGLVRLLDDGGRAGRGDGGAPPADLVRTAERLVPDVPAWGTAVRVARHALGVHVAAGRLFGGGRS